MWPAFKSPDLNPAFGYSLQVILNEVYQKRIAELGDLKHRLQVLS